MAKAKPQFEAKIDLETLSVDNEGRFLLEVINEEIHNLVRQVADDTTGDAGSLSIRVDAKSHGDGSVVLKPVLKANPPKRHFAPRTAAIHGDEVKPEGDISQMSFDDLARRAARMEKELKEARTAAKREMLGEDDEPVDDSPEGRSHLSPVKH